MRPRVKRLGPAVLLTPMILHWIFSLRMGPRPMEPAHAVPAEVVGATTGHREVTLSQTLNAGRYWLASLFGGATPGTVYTVASPTIPLGTWLATPHVARPAGYRVDGVASGGLPSTWPAGQLIAVTSAPMVCVKVTV